MWNINIFFFHYITERVSILAENDKSYLFACDLMFARSRYLSVILIGILLLIDHVKINTVAVWTSYIVAKEITLICNYYNLILFEIVWSGINDPFMQLFLSRLQLGCSNSDYFRLRTNWLKCAIDYNRFDRKSSTHSLFISL